MENGKLRRGATDLGDGSAEFVLWAPSYRDIAIDRVLVRSEHLGAPPLLVAARAADGAHWVARGAIEGPLVAYDFVVQAHEVSTGRSYESHVSDPYAREVHRDFRSVLRRTRTPHAFAPFARPALRDLVIYELHVHNFTAEDPSVGAGARGTYEGVVLKLPHLVDLGFNAIELMPVFDYSDPWHVGVRWNYITACHLCAPHRGYAAREDHAREEFIALVEACHAHGIAVIIDAVFNQVSRRFSYARIYDPDYNRRDQPNLASNPLLGDFGGTDPNPGSFPYRNHDWGGCDLDYEKPAALDFVQDVLDVWFHELGVDGLRFDHTLGFYRWKDQAVGAGAVVAAAQRLGGDSCYRIAEHFSSEENERTLLVDAAFNSLWAKGFHYAIEDVLQRGNLAHLEYRMNVRAQGFPDDKPPVVFSNSHDDERLVNRGGSPWWRLQGPTIALYTHPGVPMVYMGDEYAEDDRTRHATGLPREINPLDWDQSEATGPLLRLHRALGFLRRRLAVLRTPALTPIWRYEHEQVLIYGRGEPEPSVIVALNFSEHAQVVRIPVPAADGAWFEFLFNLQLESRNGAMRFTNAEGHVWDRILVPSAYAHIYCRQRCWTDDEWTDLLARDRTPAWAPVDQPG